MRRPADLIAHAGGEPGVAYTSLHAEIASTPTVSQVGWRSSVRLADLWLDRNLLVVVRLPGFNGVGLPMGRVLYDIHTS